MAQTFYTEFFGMWDGTEGGKGSADDNQWQIYNVTENHSIPPSAVLEIACVNEYNIAEYNIGIRSTVSSGQADNFRRIQLAEAENGDNQVIMHVQLDSSGNIQYFVEHFDRLHFDILGYWQGCEYTDAFDEFDPSTPSGWENYALDQYGVGSGQASEIVMSNTADAVDHTLGVRTSGSTIDRRFEIKEAESGGEECLSVLVSPSGNTAGINIWSSNIANCSFRLVGYFSVPPADYQEIDVVFPTPDIDDSWTELNVGASGIPSNVLAQFIIGQRFFDAITVGMRETNSIIHDRKLILDRQDTDLTAPNWGGIHSNVDNDGKLEYYCSDVSDAPFYKIIGYWENFINIETPFPENNNIDLFIRGLNPNAHYIESYTDDWSPSVTDGSWQTIDMSVHNYKPNTVAEVIMYQQDWDTAAWLGARSSGSDLQRRFLLRDSYDGFIEADCITWNVPLNANSEFESSSSGNPNYDDSFGLGYWVGCKYVELFETFQASAQSGWINHNLSSYGVPSGKITEIVITSFDEDLPQSGGIRQIGSTTDRVIEINGLRSNWDPNPGGVDAISMFVNTSGSNSTIQVYAGNSGLMNFTVVGYWDVAPGNYTESMTVITPITTTNAWKRIDLYTDYNIPSGAIVDIYLGNYRYNAGNVLGVREINPQLSQTDSQDRSTPNRRTTLRETNDTESGGFGIDVVRMHVNTINGYAEFYHSRANADTRIWSLGYWDNFVLITNEINNQINLFTLGHKTFQESGNLFIHGHENIFESGNQGYLYINGKDTIVSSGDLFIHGQDTIETSGNLYILGANVYKTDVEFSADYPSGLLCYTTGSGIIPASSVLPPLLFMHGHDIISNSGTSLFITSHENIVESGNLFLKVSEPINRQITLYIHNIIDPGSGLIRETNAIFYLSRRHHNDTSTAIERIKNNTWDVPNIFFDNDVVLEQPGAIDTVGDGTLPHYNDMGGGFSSCQFGQALIGDVPLKQNILDSIISPSDYPYAGSGSITTAFWMSGSKTSGNIIEIGWFYDNADKSENDHTIGIKITSESGLQVLTSVRDLPYDLSGGLWWGSTTHYGTPSGDNWNWRSPDEYWAWNEQWSNIYIEHDDIAFFIIRAEFIASGIDGNSPNHMKVHLSVDGQPWTYIGSGLTGPPASSLFNLDNPRNRHAENTVGIKVQAINSDPNDESLSINEIILWTDSDKFNNSELSDLYSTVVNHYRPLDEYKPTIVPPSTYIKRTVGMFTLNPTTPGSGVYSNISQIMSGLLVTLEVGLGDYGEDSSAYLLEETPPSGFYIRNIQPEIEVRYTLQGSRPTTQQQIFHDPLSGIMQPYDTIETNIYGASIRWINHDNHPQKDQRRSPTPTGIYTYKLYPIDYREQIHVDDFDFIGSGIFFGGSTGSGLFVTTTTGDTSGTTSGLVGGIINLGFDLYITGPTPVSGNTVNLYIRTIESFTSAYIGTASRTPEVIDFIFAADGNAAIETMAGIEYGPALYTMGPLQYDNNSPLYIKGPIQYVNNFPLYIKGPLLSSGNKSIFIHGLDTFNTNNDYPSGMLLRIGDGHQSSNESGSLFIHGPTSHSGEMSLYIKAGIFEPPIDLFTLGHIAHNAQISEFIKGPEFIISSGSFTYPGDIGDFTFPYGDPSPTLYLQAHTPITGSSPLYIGPLQERQSWTLYLKTENNNINNTTNLFTHGFEPSVSGANQTFNNMRLYLEAIDADFPYVAGGTENWTIFLKAQSGNLTDNNAWKMFLKADSTTSATHNLHTYGHASGESPHGNELSGSVGLICSIDPDDPSRIGFIPFDSNIDPWTLFLKGNPGHFNTADLYMSGAAPINLFASGNLFIEGLFEQEISTASLYLMGISGIFNNGPNGLSLFLNADILVYNTSGNLYMHGY